jgi:hypothetical protein
MEGAYCQGTATIRALFDLIVMIYKLQMQLDFILHVIWITGTRMIQQAMDGRLRGKENCPATYMPYLGGMVPLILGSRERRPGLEDWTRGQCDTGIKLEVLEPIGWFTETHKLGDFGWFPAPAAADAAIYQLYEALH